MFDIAPSELLLVAVVALVVIGPKDLPRAMRFVGQWVGKARGMARHFRSGFDEMVRQAEMEEMEKRWAAENARIMAEHPGAPPEEADDATHAWAPGGPMLPRDESGPSGPESAVAAAVHAPHPTTSVTSPTAAEELAAAYGVPAEHPTTAPREGDRP